MLLLAGHIGGTKTDSSRRAVRLSRLTTRRYDGQGTRLCLKSRRRSSLGLLIQDGANSAVPDDHARLGGARMGEPLAVLAHQASRRPALAVAVALAAALGIDWLLAPNSYPVAAAYGVALLIAAQLLSPRGVAAAL